MRTSRSVLARRVVGRLAVHAYRAQKALVVLLAAAAMAATVGALAFAVFSPATTSPGALTGADCADAFIAPLTGDHSRETARAAYRCMDAMTRLQVGVASEDDFVAMAATMTANYRFVRQAIVGEGNGRKVVQYIATDPKDGSVVSYAVYLDVNGKVWNFE